MTDSKCRLVILGSGTPHADPERSGPSVAVTVGDRSHLVDFGPGVVRRAAAAHAAGIEALAPRRLARPFLTHLHSDHTAGYPGHRVVATDVAPGAVYRDEAVTVEAFVVDHGSWPSAYGHRFSADGRVIVISGDTRPTEALVEAATGCDVLVHEVYSTQGFAKRSPDWQAYHAQFHTSTEELAQIADRVRPELLVLYHQLFMGVTDDELVAEIRKEYDGDVVSSKDLDVFRAGMTSTTTFDRRSAVAGFPSTRLSEVERIDHPSDPHGGGTHSRLEAVEDPVIARRAVTCRCGRGRVSGRRWLAAAPAR